MSENPKWLTYEQVIAFHSRQLRRFGGAPGLRDEGLLRSALERPVNKWQYEQADLAILAAAYAFGLAKNHPFIDGNKRIGFATGILFLELNGYVFTASEVDAVLKTLALAASAITENDYAKWLEKSCA